MPGSCAGFVEPVTLLPEYFIERGEELFRLAPVRHVILTDMRGHLPALAKCRWLESVATLEFRTLAGAKISDLLSSPHLTRLTNLILRFSGIEDEDAAVLANHPAVARLATLDLYGGAFG